jgi:hypothetical protein
VHVPLVGGVDAHRGRAEQRAASFLEQREHVVEVVAAATVFCPDLRTVDAALARLVA